MKTHRKRKLFVIAGSILIILLGILLFTNIYQSFNEKKLNEINQAIVIEAANPEEGAQKVKAKIDEIFKSQDQNYKVISGEIKTYNKNVLQVFKVNVNGKSTTIIFNITSFIDYQKA